MRSYGEHNNTESKLQCLINERVASRIWAQDKSLWPEPTGGSDISPYKFGWLDTRRELPAFLKFYKKLNVSILKNNFDNCVMLGMGGSLMASKLFLAVFCVGSNKPKLMVWDSGYYETISRFVENISIKSTLFIVASKSGTTIETIKSELYLRSLLKHRKCKDISKHFAAISDDKSPLIIRAQSGEFGNWFISSDDIGGRFSSLSVFGFLPVSLMNENPVELSRRAEAMAVACRYDSIANPGLNLGNILGMNAVAGKNKITMFTSPGLEAFTLWAEQLVAESTGKNQTGLIPVMDEPRLSPETYGMDRNFIYLRSSDADNNETDIFASAIEEQGHSVTKFNISGPLDLGGEIFRWQFAVAVASHILAVFPFDQPDVEESKQRALQLLDHDGMGDMVLTESIKSVLSNLLRNPCPSDYVAIVAFVAETDKLTNAFYRLRRAITNNTGMPTVFGYGPRYLHSTGQLFKGGPDSVRMLGLISHGSGLINRQDEQYTHKAINTVQAFGDFQTMANKGRTIGTAILGEEPDVEINEIAAHLEG